MVIPGRDIPMKEFLATLKDEWTRDNVSDTAGSLTFYLVLAIFPFLLFLVALASLVISPQEATALVDELSRVAPPAVTDIIGGRIEQLGRERNTGLLTFSALAAIWAASGGIDALTRALNTAYDVEDERPYWKLKLRSLLFTIVTAAIALAATLVAVVLPPIAEMLGGPVGTALLWLRLPVAGLLMMFVWALLYWALPDVEQKFSFLTPGSVVGVVLWGIASWGFSKYVTNFGNYDATYGTLGGVIVLLLWMWISSQVVLLGAEVNAVVEHLSPEGKRPGAKAQADTGSGKEPREGKRSRASRPRRDRRMASRPGRTQPGAGGRSEALVARQKSEQKGDTMWAAAGALVLGAMLHLLRGRRTA